MFQTTNQKNIIFNRKKGLGGLGNWDITMWLGAKQHETWCAVGCVSVNNNNNINNTSCDAVAAAATCSNMQQHAATCSNMQQHAATCSNMQQHAATAIATATTATWALFWMIAIPSQTCFEFSLSRVQLYNQRGTSEIDVGLVFFFVFNVFP